MIEFAMVAPLVFFIIFTALEFGRTIMVIHGMEEAVRQGCRALILEGALQEDAETAISPVMQTFGVSNYQIAFSPDPPSSACQWDPVTVTLSASLGDVMWIPTPRFISDQVISVSCTLPQESDLCSSSP